MTYDGDRAERSLQAPMHNMGEVEYQGTWARCWFDLGTSDAIALDVLLNALKGFNREYVALERVIFGGENEDWPTPQSGGNAVFQD